MSVTGLDFRCYGFPIRGIREYEDFTQEAFEG
jgi:hypothetical protein